VSYPRQIEGAVRKPDDRRKRAREAKKQRQAAAEEARREEVKRLKNLKKREIEDK
jgi:protein KRI1